jgi:hypothetical protein
MSQQKKRATPSEQSELRFDEAAVNRPRWAELTHETRRSVTELFARMLRQRRRERVRSAVGEVEHE